MAVNSRTRTARTLSPTFSFYVPSSNEGLIRDCAASADAVVVHGRNGPPVVETMRRQGFDGVVLFDRANYERSASSVPPGAWLEAQTRAGADRLLTGGN